MNPTTSPMDSVEHLGRRGARASRRSRWSRASGPSSAPLAARLFARRRRDRRADPDERDTDPPLGRRSCCSRASRSRACTSSSAARRGPQSRSCSSRCCSSRPLRLVPLLVAARRPDLDRCRTTSARRAAPRPLDLLLRRRLVHDRPRAWCSACSRRGPPRVAPRGLPARPRRPGSLTDVVRTSIRERLARRRPPCEIWSRSSSGHLPRRRCPVPIGLRDRVRGRRRADRARCSSARCVWLLDVFSRERSERYTAALELHRAYRGTVMLLSDVVEADDNYTADHCRSVVELVDAASRDELDIDAGRAPGARVRRPAARRRQDRDPQGDPATSRRALTDDEFELMKTHTIEGQVLLDRVGGLLGRVGEIVRSCHERWDGQRLPGRPRAARRSRCPPHRVRLRRLQRHDDRPPLPRGMSQETAIEELRPTRAPSSTRASWPRWPR